MTDIKAKKRSLWNDDQYKVFINIWKKKKGDLNKAKRNSHIILQMQNELEINGIIASVAEIKTRMHNLKSKYRKEKNDVGSTGGSPSDWDLFNDMKDIVGTSKFISSSDIVEESFEDYTFDMVISPLPSPSAFPPLSALSPPPSNASLPSTSNSPLPSTSTSNSSTGREKGKINDMEMERKYKHRESWTNDEVRVLVNLWKERKDELNKVKRNQHIIIAIKKNLEDYQIFKDIDEIKNKMHNLTTKFRKEKNVATNVTPSDWSLYGDLEEIYEGNSTKTIKFTNHVEEPDPLLFRPKKLKKKNINEIILYEIKKSNEEMKKSNDNIEKYINQAKILEEELLKVEKERNQILKLLIDKL